MSPSERRIEALKLALAHNEKYRGAQARDVINTAERFDKWIRGDD